MATTYLSNFHCHFHSPFSFQQFEAALFFYLIAKRRLIPPSYRHQSLKLGSVPSGCFWEAYCILLSSLMDDCSLCVSLCQQVSAKINPFSSSSRGTSHPKSSVKSEPTPSVKPTDKAEGTDGLVRLHTAHTALTWDFISSTVSFSMTASCPYSSRVTKQLWLWRFHGFDPCQSHSDPDCWLAGALDRCYCNQMLFTSAVSCSWLGRVIYHHSCMSCFIFKWKKYWQSTSYTTFHSSFIYFFLFFSKKLASNRYIVMFGSEPWLMDLV